MKNFVLIFILIGCSNSFANKNWKNAGKYFENKYLLELQEKLKESDLSASRPLSILPLKRAFLIYQTEAQKGDIDAQFRLGALYEQNRLKEKGRHQTLTSTCLTSRI